MPASITLFGNSTSDSKTLVLRAVEKHYPALKNKYTKLFSASNELPEYYATAFYRKMEGLEKRYGLPLRIIGYGL